MPLKGFNFLCELITIKVKFKHSLFAFLLFANTFMSYQMLNFEIEFIRKLSKARDKS